MTNLPTFIHAGIIPAPGQQVSSMGLPTNSPPTSGTPRPPQSNKRTGLLRALFAFKHSYDGLRCTWRSESAFRQESVLAVILIPAAVFIPIDAVGHAMLIASVLLVLLVELLNSAIEAVVDRISLDRHELSRQAKDCGSAAVLLSLVICVTTWGTLLWPLAARWLHTRV